MKSLLVKNMKSLEVPNMKSLVVPNMKSLIVPNMKSLVVLNTKSLIVPYMKSLIVHNTTSPTVPNMKSLIWSCVQGFCSHPQRERIKNFVRGQTQEYGWVMHALIKYSQYLCSKRSNPTFCQNPDDNSRKVLPYCFFKYSN